MTKKKIKKILHRMDEGLTSHTARLADLERRADLLSSREVDLDRRMKALETYNQRMYDLEKDVAALKRRHSSWR